MSYKYLNAYLSNGVKTPKEIFREDFQEKVDETFYLASDWYTIEEETVFGSGVYSELDVRINNVVLGRTGLPQGDDYKTILFKSFDHVVKLGYLYSFSNNYWVVINTTKDNALTISAVVKRCNNFLRWQNDDGSLYSVPCSIDYGIKENRDYSTAGSVFPAPSGLIVITTQLNSKTNQIKPNQRFLFGNANNWTAFKVMGGGIENYNNIETDDNDSFGYLKLTVNVDYVNYDSDDVVNGIAEKLQNTYTLTLSESGVDGNPAGSLQLTAVVKLNNETVSGSVSWVSSDEDVATVDSSGNISFIANGSCIITASLSGNSNVNDTCNVSVGSAPVSEYQVVVSPSTNYVLENETITYNVKLVLNGVDQADVFVFTVTSPDVPTDNYVFTSIDGNSFSVENAERYLDESLTIDCVSGIHSREVAILLKGNW